MHSRVENLRTRVDIKTNLILIAGNGSQTSDYIQSILSSKYNIELALDAVSALNKITTHKPDLILCSAFLAMNEVNFLAKLKSNRETIAIPVIVISESIEEEDQTGSDNILADDYLIKPFSPKALLARIEAQIRLTQIKKNNLYQLRNVFDQAPVAITILKGPDFIIEQANATALEIWGKTKEEVMNRPVLEAIPEIESQGFFELLTNVYQTGNRFISTEHAVKLKRKEKFEDLYVNFLYEPMREIDGHISGVIAIANEVTELVLAQKAALDYAEVMEAQVAYRVEELVKKNAQIKEQKEFAESIINSSIVLISVLDPETKVLAFNNKCEEAFGKKKEEVLGRKFIEVFPSVEGTVAHQNINRALAGETVHIEQYQSTMNGKYYESFITPLRSEKGKVYAIIMTAHDISLIIESSEKLKQSNEELRRKNDELEQFAYISSHDLQEPLRKIQTFSELVSSSFDNEVMAKRYLNKIEKAASRMSDLIKAVLAYSSINTSESYFEKVDLNNTLESVKEDFELRIEQKKAIIYGENLPTINGSATQMHQLFTNLIGNSLKFSEREPVIHITSENATKDDYKKLKLDPSVEYFKVKIQDNGIGFEQQYVDRIFTIFQRLNNKVDYEGTGIGLALCKKIVENHQGIIEAESKPGEGSVFTIYLPA